jgi:exosortase A-associated hydrolase 2
MVQREAFFLPAGAGQCFCLYHPPQGPEEKGAVLYIHPFAEEMNKSRRMAALQSRALAAAGFGVLQVDLRGCGDSSGDFGDADWRTWVEDVVNASHWLSARSKAPLWLWGLRAGCLLAVDAAVNMKNSPNFIFWQPVVSGKQHWQQFMRLKMAGELASGRAMGGVGQIRQQLAAGQAVEIAGYTVVPGLADGLEKADLLPPTIFSGRVTWFELSTRDEATLAPVSQQRIDQWRAAGFMVDAKVVRGPGFWQTAEIEDAPELIAATLVALESGQ